MRVSKALDWLLDWLAQELRQDWNDYRNDVWWWATLRSVAQGWFGLAILLRQTCHHIAYGAIREERGDREPTLDYTACHVGAATDEEAHHCRHATALTAIGLAALIAPSLRLGQSPVAAAFLVSNWGLLVIDPAAPLLTRTIAIMKP